MSEKIQRERKIEGRKEREREIVLTSPSDWKGKKFFHRSFTHQVRPGQEKGNLKLVNSKSLDSLQITSRREEKRKIERKEREGKDMVERNQESQPLQLEIEGSSWVGT